MHLVHWRKATPRKQSNTLFGILLIISTSLLKLNLAPDYGGNELSTLVRKVWYIPSVRFAAVDNIIDYQHSWTAKRTRLNISIYFLNGK